MATTKNNPANDLLKKEILNIALEIFVRDGYFSTTGAMIASEAGISEEKLFSLFETKENLLHTIVAEAVHLIFDGVDPNQDGKLQEVELLFFINDYFDSVEKNLDFFRFFYSLRLQPGVVDQYKHELHEIVSPKLNIIRKYFSKEGTENPKMETRFLVSMLDGIAMNFVLEPDGYPIDEMQQKVLNMYIKKAEIED
ncbi:TetR/AcrR family transcriptional regulator [Labilibaculum sp. K2S]|uniref:TetR/AcrR family transcriptional regulator n=1 Tax=Labilibaculum sp. K2S TaxID=3056386 RepID=UPI0025A4B52B|nr:TetR/AcrR family transcriptional regulator [Labilibaculum sp. K2S]MDM8158328.1 TetR/AcrR family transcriptional regulator [Labilibaculum sp. K2S]